MMYTFADLNCWFISMSYVFSAFLCVIRCLFYVFVRSLVYVCACMGVCIVLSSFIVLFSTFHSLPIPIFSIERQHTPLRCILSTIIKVYTLLFVLEEVNFIARHGVTYGRMRSLLGRNEQLYCEK